MTENNILGYVGIGRNRLYWDKEEQDGKISLGQGVGRKENYWYKKEQDEDGRQKENEKMVSNFLISPKPIYTGSKMGH